MTLHILATLCLLSDPTQCRTQEVTNDRLEDVSMQTCALGQPQLAEFMRAWPQYRLKRWVCQMGERGVKL